MIAVVFAAILALSPHVEADRARDLAADISEVASAEPLFEGTAGATATALLLATIAKVESEFLERIEACQCRKRECDQKRSVGLWQIMRGDPAMCGDRKAQARAALSVLREFRGMCADLPTTLGGYNSGRCQKTRASRYVHSSWLRLMREEGIVMRGDGVAYWKEGV